MKLFRRDDGQALRVVEGFRKQVRSAPRVSGSPKPEWTDADYAAAADKRLHGNQMILAQLSRWGGAVEGARMLEVGCGAGIDCLLMALQPVRGVLGIDMALPLFEAGEKGERARRLARAVLEKLGLGRDIDGVFERLPLRFAIMNATALEFPDDSFDFLWSRVAMEHVQPIEKGLAEMARVVRPEGLIYHHIDPYFHVRGCHATGVVDIPWAHARLSPGEYRRFVTESEGEEKAARRGRHLETLNPFTLRQWRRVLEASPFEILDWREEGCPLSEMLLQTHPEVEETLLEGVERRDLIHGSIKVWLRNKKGAV